MLKDKKQIIKLGKEVLPFVPMILWGSIFTFVKIGYKVFSIDSSNTADVILFAAVRFLVCGIFVCLIAFFTKAKIEKPIGKSVIRLSLIGVFAIVLHYTFLYIGLTVTDSSKAALLKQIGPLLYTCFSFLFVKSEKFSMYKILGGIIGFAGILFINIGTDIKGFSVGDILILSASVCSVISMMISENNSTANSPLWVTGISQLSGGIILFISAVVMGSNCLHFTLRAAGVFLYICSASILGYVLFYYVQRTVKLSKLSIIKFSEPLFTCLFGAVLLNENIFRIQYLIAFVMISLGIALAYKEKEHFK